MTPVIEQLLHHHSVRHFAQRPLDEQTIHTLITAAQAAPTSHYLQAYRFLGITEPQLKKAIADICGQSHVENNGHLFIVLADLSRPAMLMPGIETLGSTENLLVATIDAALAAQNLTVAAKSLGLGCCYLGSIRNNTQALIELLHLPPYVYPLFGIAVGYPENDHASTKPRLPFQEIYQENAYDAQNFQQNMTKYDQTVADYYHSRQQNARTDHWSEQLCRYFSTPRRLDVHDTLQQQGYLKQ